jgi:hypothetical protein
MRPILRLVLLLLVLTLATAPSLSAPSFVTSVVADDDDKGQGNDDDDGDDDRGEGNDDKGKDKDKEKGKDKENKGKQVEATAGYTIEVACDDLSDDATTDCTFTAVEPDGGKKVTHVLIPAELACAETSDKDVTWVDPDPNIHRAGLRHEGQKPFTVTFDGLVTTGAAASYWVKAADEVMPAEGPALVCETAASEFSVPASPTTEAGPTESGGTLQPTSEPTAEATSTPARTTGTILVSTYTCTGITADTPDVDWFGACTPGGDASTFSLSGGSDTMSMDTAEDGTATFADLAPSTYDLDDTTRSWCHAESDNVNTEGNVVVEAGATTNVWLFYCK